MSDNESSQVYAFFRSHSTANEAKSKKAGRPIFDDVEVCEIRLAGNKLTVGVFPAHETCDWHTDPKTGYRERQTYAQKYNEQYMAFKKGAAQIASGTPLEELTFLSQGKRLELKALNVHTAEALASLDGGPLKMLGMNGRELKDQAQIYLDNAAKTVTLESLSDEIKRLKEENEKLAFGAKESLKSEAAADDDENPFSVYEKEDIIAWINDVAPDEKIDGRAKQETLAKQAFEINKKLADKEKAA